MLDQIRIKPGDAARLADRPTNDKLGLESKSSAPVVLAKLTEQLATLQTALWAEDRRSLLVVLQAMDAAGKDGTIRQVFSGLNPQGCTVIGFKAPTTTELDHDYLWRVHAACPRRGEIGIFNRSHYEDVLAVRLLGLAPEKQWRKRFAHIRHFEQMLVDEGTAVVKINLHISADEQLARFKDRLADPTKRWKFRAGDLDVNRRYDDYLAAYEEAINETTTEAAPWYVVPADRKWVRNIAVSRILVHTLETMNPKFPPPDPALDELKI
jgi:PPK2 family polyphosphate:nucleotide phosphotransferase